MHADDRAGTAGVAIPADHRALLDGNARGDVRRQHLIAIALILLLEEVPRRHADDAGRNAFLLQFLVYIDTQAQFAAGANEDHLRFGGFCVRQDIGAARDFGGRRIFFPIECRQSLPAQDQARRLVFRAEDDAIRFGDLVRIRWA
jgi:hypothetical protein